MNNRQTLTLQMIRSVLATLRDTELPRSIVGLPVRVAQLEAQADELNLLGECQTRPTQAQTAARDVVLGAMVDAALDLASSVALYATDAKLPDLLRAVKITPSDFPNARIAHRPWLATRIADAAETVLPHLAPHVTAGTLADVRVKIRAAEDAVAQPRATIEAKGSATRRIEVVRKAARETLQQIDRLVFPLRRTAPGLYADYRSARRIVGLAARRPEEPEPEMEPAASNVSATPEAPAPASQPAPATAAAAQPAAGVEPAKHRLSSPFILSQRCSRAHLAGRPENSERPSGALARPVACDPPVTALTARG